MLFIILVFFLFLYTVHKLNEYGERHHKLEIRDNKEYVYWFISIFVVILFIGSIVNG